MLGPLRLARSPWWWPGLAVALAMVLIGLEQPHPERVVNIWLAAVSVLLTWGVAVAIRVREPQRRLATLLFVLAAAQAVQPALGGSSNAWLYLLGRAGRFASEWVLVWVMLAYPSGRLHARIDRVLLGCVAAAMLLLWLPSNAFTADLRIGGPFSLCTPDCPPNVLFVSDRPDWALALLNAFRVCAVLLVLAIVLRLAQRWRSGTPLMRRMLAPVELAFIVRLLGLIPNVAASTWQVLPVALFWLIPLAMAFGLLRARLWIAAALQQLVAGLRAMPSRSGLQALMARALGDASLTLGFWAPAASSWVDAEGRDLQLPSAGEPRRATRMFTGDRGQPAAVLVHDAALAEEPALLDAVLGSLRVVLAGQQLAAELQSTQREAAQAAASERERIERDLHDGAQQRLLALRLKLGVVQRLLDADPQRAAGLLAETGPDIDAALRELRELAHGVLPGLLLEEGLAAALAQLARSAACRVQTRLQAVGRLAPSVEQAVYFCCAEALQNVAKHAGTDAQVELRLEREADTLRFAVSDDGGGRGTRAALPPGGRGLDNMRQRLAAVGGQLTVEALEGGGVRVRGTVTPLRPA